MSAEASASNSVPEPRRYGFQPGKSGNPGGRPAIIKPVRELARRYTTEAMNKLVKLMRSDDAPHHVQFAAASELLDRAWGKAPQKVDVDVTLFDAMDPATRAAIDGICAILAQQLEQAPAVIEAQAVVIEPEKNADSSDPISPKP